MRRRRRGVERRGWKMEDGRWKMEDEVCNIKTGVKMRKLKGYF